MDATSNNLEELADKAEPDWPAQVDIHAGDQLIVRGQDAKAQIVFDDAKQAKRILSRRDTFALAEAFIHGEAHIEGDFCEAVKVKDVFAATEPGFWAKTMIVLKALSNYRYHNPEKDRRYIAHHYELPDDFYRLFLGPTMTYSCAYFARPDDDLTAAQEQKIDHLLRKVRLQEGEDLLDIGCGWGALIIKAARDYGARATGITLSKTQYAYVQKEIDRAGLNDRCRVALLDYRDINRTEQFDKIISVGMYEHVGSKNLPTYFKRIYDLLRPEGLFVNHGITRKWRPDWRKFGEAIFVDRHIFPGGEIHPSGRVVSEMEEAGFEVFDVESLRKHYARTLRHWVENLQGRKTAALNLVSEEKYRAWLLYMAGCALSFEEGYLNVHQVCGAKTTFYGGAAIPHTRDHLYRSIHP